MSDLEKAIIKTIIYFDIFEFPLTLMEIWEDLYGLAASLEEVRVALETSAALKTKINCQQGFYFLVGREATIRTRLSRYNIAERKFKKAKKISQILVLIPYVKLIAVCNNLALSNVRAESDIDLFIITSKGRIWITRFLSVMILKILRLRPTEGDTRDKICLSFLISEDYLNLREFCLESGDIYFYYWLGHLAPIYEEVGIFDKFVEANNWLKEFLPNTRAYETNRRRQVKLGMVGRAIKRINKIIFGLIPEKLIKKIQLNNLAPQLKQLANLDTRVVINDQVLKFHANDRREEFRKKFEDRSKSII